MLSNYYFPLYNLKLFIILKLKRNLNFFFSIVFKLVIFSTTDKTCGVIRYYKLSIFVNFILYAK